MSNAGITAQYGFLYQRKVFILHVLNNANTKQRFIFEGRDDIEISPEAQIYAMFDSDNLFVQVKSGYVDETCFCKIICNWLLLDSHESSLFELVLENDLGFDCYSDETIKKIQKYIIEGKGKKQSSIARKAYNKFKNEISGQPDNIIEKVAHLVSTFTKTVCSMDTVDKEILEKYANDYCLDIMEYDKAKEKRLERLITAIDTGINNAVKAKKPYSLLYPELMQMIGQIKEAISDSNYSVDISSLKKRSELEARKLIEEKTKREVRQLYLVDKTDSFVVKGIVNEIVYKDFRDVYATQKNTEILNIEQNAKENHDLAIFALGDDAVNPRSVYVETNNRHIEGNLLPGGPIYRNGCYVYLTGDSIGEENQISWGTEDGSE